MSKRYKKPTTQLIARDLSENLGKVPPQAIDLEMAVLGALMLEKQAVIAIIDILQADDFYQQSHNEIYAAILGLYHNQQPIDMLTVVQQLRKVGKIEVVGGAYYIAELTSKVSSAANIEYHARIVAEMAMKRRIIETGSALVHQGYEEGQDVFELMDAAQSKLDQTAGHYIRHKARKARVVYDESIQQLLEARKKDGLVGVPSGYTLLDRLTGGWRTPDLIIIAGRPAMGKSAVVGNFARNAAVDFKLPVAIFSLEMSAKQLMDRMIACDSEVDLDRIIKGRIEEYELLAISHKTARLAEAPIYIDDTAALSILEFRAKTRRMKAEHGIKLIIVDYLQLMRGNQDAYNREQEVSSITQALKAVAKELELPVLALSQLSRGVETRGGDKRPQLADLRESGAIEQDADIVAFLYRPEYYKIMVYEDGTPTNGLMEVIFAKHRNGRCDSVLLKFSGKYSKISDYDSMPQAPTQLPLPSYKDMQTGRRELVEKDEPADDLPF